MSLLIETIKIKNGRVYNIAYHNKRFNASRKAVFEAHKDMNLRPFINIPREFKIGLVKCRVLYDREIQEISFQQYSIGKWRKIQVVHSDINYNLKWADRLALKELYEQKGDADDILIIRNGYVTDCYYTNVAFLTKSKKWVTPDPPLLTGTQRAYLLDKNMVQEQSIQLSDLSHFTHICLFNAMISFGKIVLPIDAIEYD